MAVAAQSDHADRISGGHRVDACLSCLAADGQLGNSVVRLSIAGGSHLRNDETAANSEQPIAKFFGNISYSLYLYHELVIYLLTKVHFTHWRYQIAVTVCLSILAATASYYCVERPFLKLKDRLRPRKRAIA
jgi:peptidoglycan/LPS O-acetylase OafA/YrhL